MLAGFHEKFIPVYLHSNQVRKPTGKRVARLFRKRCIATPRMYQPCFAVYIELAMSPTSTQAAHRLLVVALVMIFIAAVLTGGRPFLIITGLFIFLDATWLLVTCGVIVALLLLWAFAPILFKPVAW